MERRDIIREIAGGRNCAQIVLGHFGDDLEYDAEELDGFVRHLGMGMYMGQTCGAVTGALIALSLAGKGRKEAVEFEEQFRERCGSCLCSELLQMPAEQAVSSGKFLEVCPGYIGTAVSILEDLL